MKLKSCKFCRSYIAKSCTICPYCGGKNKSGLNCGFLIGLFFAVFIVCQIIVCAKEDKKDPKKEESQLSELRGVFSALDNQNDIDRYLITDKKITVIYKEDLPDYVELKMRNFAASGSRCLGNRMYTAECAVSQAPDNILHSETREDNMTTAITFSENKYAKNKEKEKKRIAEAERQQRISLQKIKAHNIRKEFVKNNCNASTLECYPISDLIKSRMHDPSSYEHVKTEISVSEDASIIITTTFRGKNVFGALIMQTFRFKVSPSGDLTKIN